MVLYVEYSTWDQRCFFCFQAAKETGNAKAVKDNLENEVQEAKSRMQKEERTRVSHFIYFSVVDFPMTFGHEREG